MHEMSLATALISLVHEQAVAARARRVTRLVLEIGALSHVDAHALRFAVDAAALGGMAEGAELEIREPEGTAYCLDCETSVVIAARGTSMTAALVSVGGGCAVSPRVTQLPSGPRPFASRATSSQPFEVIAT